MEQIIGLVVFLIAWFIISAIIKSSKKQQEAAKKQQQASQIFNQQTTKPAATADEINKLIEMFTGINPTPQTTSPVAPNSEYKNPDIVESIEATEEDGGIETPAPTYSTVDEYVPYSSYIDDYSSEDNLHSVLTEKPENEIIINRSKNQPNPLLSDFDLKKAVIYSTILEPKYN